MTYTEAAGLAVGGAQIMRKAWEERPHLFPFRYLINARWWMDRFAEDIWSADDFEMIPHDALLEIATDYDSKMWGFWKPEAEAEDASVVSRKSWILSYRMGYPPIERRICPCDALARLR